MSDSTDDPFAAFKTSADTLHAGARTLNATMRRAVDDARKSKHSSDDGKIIRIMDYEKPRLLKAVDMLSHSVVMIMETLQHTEHRPLVAQLVQAYGEVRKVFGMDTVKEDGVPKEGEFWKGYAGVAI